MVCALAFWSSGPAPAALACPLTANAGYQMNSIRIALAVLTATAALPASAQGPIYAIYGTKAVGPAGTVTSVNVGILPSGKQADCMRQIENFESAVRRTRTTAGPELIASRCAVSVPKELKPMVDRQVLPDAFVVKQSGDWAPIYTAWYGLLGSDPVAMCNRLVSGMRATLKPGQVDVECFPPKPLGMQRSAQ